MRLLKGIGIELARLILAGVFMLSGILKAIDPVGTSIKINEYVVSLVGYHRWVSEYISLPLAMLLCSIEFLLGAFLLSGIYRRICSRLAFVVMTLMTAITLYIYVANPVEDCGCFGDAIKLSNGVTLLKNLILLPLSFVVMRHARRLIHLFRRHERWLPAFFAFLGIGQFLLFNYRHLPIVDFRPYRIGYNLKERIAQADAEQQKLLLAHTFFIYSRGGEEKAFRQDNLPDSSWTYIRTEQDKELSKIELKYDFVLLSSEGEDMSNEILTDTTGVFLLLSADWSSANEGNIAQFNELYRYCQDKGIKFYGVSGNSLDKEDRWRYQSGADYPILNLDPTTIKTVVRSNPGLLLLKSGIILDKISVYDLPRVEDIPIFVGDRLKGTVPEPRPLWRSSWLLMLFVSVVAWGLLRRGLRRLRILLYKYRFNKHNKQKKNNEKEHCSR